jgi:hypothetical protein
MPGVWSVHEFRILANRWVNGLATTIPHLPSRKKRTRPGVTTMMKVNHGNGGGNFTKGGMELTHKNL